MSWLPNKYKGFTVKSDGVKIEKLTEVLILIQDLKDNEVDPADWAEVMIDAGAELIRNGSYWNYTWTIDTGPNQELRIAYVEKKRGKEIVARSLTVREWFNSRDKE